MYTEAILGSDESRLWEVRPESEPQQHLLTGFMTLAMVLDPSRPQNHFKTRSETIASQECSED